MKKITILTISLFFIINLLILIISFKNIFLNRIGYVKVKGVSEKFVKADRAYWTISFVNAGNDLNLIKNKNQNDLEIVISFLKDGGFKESDYNINPIELIDMNAREYKDPNQTNRYIMSQGVSIITENVDLVTSISQKLYYLIDKNVSIKSSYNDIKPIYKFTKLSSIKQEMLKEATMNARKAAEQFAIDSKAKVGKIKYANQGVFSINSKNKSYMYGDSELFEKEKEVRVVITIDYWLK